MLFMIIIFGSEGREKNVDRGEFFCPVCRKMRPYIHKKITQDFTLYFLPIFEMKELDEYVVCEACHRAFPPRVLEERNDYYRQEDIPDVEDTPEEMAAQYLKSGMPVPEVFRKLVNSGVEKKKAGRILERIMGDIMKVCTTCQSTYYRNILECSRCGGKLKLMPR